MSKLKKTIAILFAAALTAAAGALVACGDEPSYSSSSSQQTLQGFTVEESITVQAGERVVVEVPTVTDALGQVNVYYDVTDVDGGYVEVTYDEFLALDGSGYVITYKALDCYGEEHIATTKVNVEGEIELLADYKTLVEVGESITINPVCSYENPTFEYEVTYEDGSILTVEDQEFVCDKVGKYSVSITATDGGVAGEYTYDFYARAKAREGEVEAIGTDWEILREIQNRSTNGWEITNTEESGVKDRFGGASQYAALTFTEETMTALSGTGAYFYLNPRFNYQYYLDMAYQGYEYISIWIYSDAETQHRVYLCKPNLSTNYIIYPKQWNELQIPILKPRLDSAESFVNICHEYVDNKREFLFFENYTYDGFIRELGFTMYIGGIYAVNPDKQVQLIDVNGKTTVDLSTAPVYGELDGLESDYANMQWTLTPQYAKSADEMVIVNGCELNNVQNMNGIYTAVAYLNGWTVWSGEIDFYNSANGIEWNDMTDLSYAVVREDKSRSNHYIMLNSIEAVTSETAGVPAGAPEGNYFKFNWAGSGTVFSVLPVHSISYYAMYRNKGWAMQFTYYTDFAAGEGNLSLRYFLKESQKNATKGAWKTVGYSSVAGHTENYTLEKIVANWGNLVSLSATGGSTTGIIEFWNGASDQTLYLGNICFKRAALTGEDTLVNVATAPTEFDLMNTVSQENMATLEKYAGEETLTWTLTKAYDTECQKLASSVINPKDVEKRAYTLTAELDGETVYSALIDFYDPADGIVWNDMTDAGLAIMRSSTESSTNKGTPSLTNASTSLVSSTDTGVPEGAPEGNYYKYTFSGTATILSMLPMHSLEYYKLYEGQGYAWNFPMYNATDSRCRYFGMGLQKRTLTKNTWIDMGYGWIWNTDNGIKTPATTYTLDNLVAYWANMSSTDILTGNYYAGMFTLWDAVTDGTVYIGEIRFSLPPYDDGSKLVDVSGLTEYDLLANASEEAKAALTLYESQYGALTWKLTTQYSGKTTVLDGSKVSFADYAKRVYTVNAEINDETVYTAVLDFYDSTDSIVWNDITDAGLAIMRSHTGHSYNSSASSLTNASTSLVSSTDTGVPEGAPEGNYYKYTFSGTATILSMLPMHSLEYYKLYEGQGYVWNFSVYNDANSTRCRYFGKDSQQSTLTTDKWIDMGYGWIMSTSNGVDIPATTYTLDNLVAHWKDMSSAEALTSSNWSGLFNSWNPVTDGTMYVGEIRFSLPPYDDGSKLVDVSGLTEYDLLANASEEAQAALKVYEEQHGALTWKLTTQYSGKTTVLDGSKVSFADYAKRVYTVNAEINGETVYTAVLDFYDPADGIVWNDMTDAGLAIMRSHTGHSYNSTESSLTNASTSLVSSADTGVPEGAPEGNYYKYTFSGTATILNMLPMHSLEYYKLYEGQGYVWNFYVYNDTNSTRCRYFGMDNQKSTLTTDKWIDMGYGWIMSTSNGVDVPATTYTLDNIVANWKDMTSTEALTSSDWSGLFNSWNPAEGTVYVGAISFTQPAQEV